jgi:cytochrome c oxidase subunit II
MTLTTLFGKFIYNSISVRGYSQMTDVRKQQSPWRVLIASSHPLFAKGLLSLLQKRQKAEVEVVGLVSTIEEALTALQSLNPDLVVVDYDDKKVNRDDFLQRFVTGEGRLRVVLLSLKEGGDEAIVYDRRSLAASRIDDWLEKWTDSKEQEKTSDLDNNNIDSVSVDLKRSNKMKHAIGAFLFVILIAAVGIFALERVRILPDQASVQAQFIDGLFSIHFYAIVILFALIVGLIVFSMVVFRRKPGDATDAAHVEGSTNLEAIWTIVPLIAVLIIAFIGADVLGKVERPEPRPLEVRVVSSQWAWSFEYLDYGIISPELVLPVDRQALLLLSSRDVIHSFWVPEFRVKQDALPGGEEMVRPLRITPTQTGNYKVLCAELCGLGHAEMRADVRVVTQGEFDEWVNR